MHHLQTIKQFIWGNKDIQDIHLGYKRARDNRLIVLEILGDNNENRKNSGTKHRTSRAKVVLITDFDDKSKTYDTATSLMMWGFVYKVGEEVIPAVNYDLDDSIECGSGIYYFLSEEEAKKYFYVPV